MESLRENKAMLYSLSCTGGFIVLLALGWVPELSEQFSIVDFPDEVLSFNVEIFDRGFNLTSISVPYTVAASLGHRLLPLIVPGQAVPPPLWRGQAQAAKVRKTFDGEEEAVLFVVLLLFRQISCCD